MIKILRCLLAALILLLGTSFLITIFIMPILLMAYYKSLWWLLLYWPLVALGFYLEID